MTNVKAIQEAATTNSEAYRDCERIMVSSRHSSPLTLDEFTYDIGDVAVRFFSRTPCVSGSANEVHQNNSLSSHHL